MEMKIEKKQSESNLEWISKNLHCEGLGPHNRSLELVVETIVDVDAKVDIGGAHRGHGMEKSFAIRLSGTSGLQYRISVHFRQRFADLLAERFADTDLSEEDSLDILMQPFRYMLNYDIHWYDERDGNWEHICIHGHRDRPITSWPGDELATTIRTLGDDLRHSVFDKNMNTLRSTLCKSYMLSWCGHHTAVGISFEDVTHFIRHIRAMEGARNKEDFEAAQQTAMLEIYGIKPILSQQSTDYIMA